MEALFMPYSKDLNGYDDDGRRNSRRQRVLDMAQLFAQTDGGEPDDFMEEAERLIPHAPKPYNDEDLTNASFEFAVAYPYRDQNGKLLYESVRYQHKSVKGAKTFMQRRPSANSNVAWVSGAGRVKVPYRWPDLIARPNDQVFFCEGEKDADRLASLGLVATTVAGQKWSEIAVDALADRDVIVMEDNDEKGRDHSQASVDALEGRAKSIRVIRLPGLGHKGDVSDWLDAGHTKDELLAYVEDVKPIGVSVGSYRFPDEKDIPIWDWLYGRHLLRGTVTGTAASGGTGKSTLAIVEALAMTSCKALLGESVPFPMRVLLINLEDDRNTMDKRIAAAMRLHNLSKEDIGDRLFVIAKGQRKIKFAKRGANGVVKLNDKTFAWLTSYIAEHKIDVVSIDPLIKTHGLNENDNEQMSALVEIIEDVALRGNCAISLWHHTRKGNGEAMSVDSARGASAFVDACRRVRVLETMSKAEAEKLRINKERHRFYFKEYNGKLNFSPPVDKVKWYELFNIEIKNHPTFGDQVGAVTSFSPDVQATGIFTEANITAIKRAVSEHQYQEDIRAKMWIGKLIGQVFGTEDKEERKLKVRQLFEMGVLKLVPGRNAKRESCMYVAAGDGPKLTPL
jgi:hypothetical protein